MDQAIFSAVHVSDFHFGADATQVNVKTVIDHHRVHGGFRGLRRTLAGPHRQTVHDPDVAQAAARFLTESFPPGTLLLVSGDVAATGTDDDLGAAVEFLHGVPRTKPPFLTQVGGPTIAAARHEVCLVPGNHDRYVDDLGLPGSTRFDHLLAAHWDAGVPVKVSVFQGAAVATKLAIVAADMCLPAAFTSNVLNFRRYGHGLASQGVVDLLCRSTEEVRRRHVEVGVCWMIHFPPTLNPNDVDPDLALIDGHRLEGAARRMGVELIIAGHVHKSDILARGRLQVVCSGSTACALEVHGNYIHYLEIRVSSSGVAALHDRRDFKWDRGQGAFLPSP